MTRTGSDALYDYVHSYNAEAVLGALPAGMVIIDSSGSIIAFGKRSEDMFGYAEAEVIGQNVSILMGPPHSARHDEYIERFQATGETRMIGTTRAETARHRDGHLFPVEVTVSRGEFEGETFFMGFLRPIDANGDNRQLVFRKLEELAQLSRVSALGAMATALAHELNQPLTSIANYMDGLHAMIARRDDIAGAQEYLDVLEKCSGLAVRAGQLLHRAREFIKGEEPHFEDSCAADLIQSAVTLALINGHKRSILLDTRIAENLPRVHVDRLQIEQVLVNLLLNAFQALDAHSSEKERHRLRISAASAAGNMVQISVEDSGPGVATELAPRIFDGFVTMKSGGLGVGLAICKQVVHLHGGVIWVDRSADLGGAAFHFTLPACEPADTAEPSP